MNEDEALLVFVDEYSRMAEAYDERVAPRFAPFAEALVARAGLRSHATVLDVSTGTGLTAVLAAKAIGGTGLVVGIDLADGALAVAQTKAARLGLRNCRFEMLDARNIVYRSGTFDAALCSFGLSSVGHEQTLREVYRVLKDGGSFHLVTWGPPSPGGAVWRELIKTHQTPTPSPELAAVREADETFRRIAEASALTDESVLTAKLQQSGFSGVRAEPQTVDVAFATVDEVVRWWQGFGDHERELREMGDAGRAAFREALEDRWRAQRHGDGYRFPWSVVFYDATT